MLSSVQVAEFRARGLLVLPNVLDADELASLHDAVTLEIQADSRGTVRERGSDAIRALHGGHKNNSILSRLCRLPTLCRSAGQLLNDAVYVYQFKINIKEKLHGEHWPWHRDFVFWQEEDGMSQPHAINVAVLIDEATALNGPLCFIPGSHLAEQAQAVIRSDGQGWQSHVSSDLKYTVPDEEVLTLAALHDIEPLIAPPGTIAFFDCRIVHGSPCNISASARRMAIVTYNSLDNAPRASLARRPDFLVESAPAPVVSLQPGARLDG